MSNPAPATRSPAVMARSCHPGRLRGPGSPLGRRLPQAAAAPTLRLMLSVPIAAPAGAAGRCCLPGRGDFMPDAAIHVDAVALGLPRGGVGAVGVQRVPVVGGLLRAVRPGDRAE